MNTNEKLIYASGTLALNKTSNIYVDIYIYRMDIHNFLLIKSTFHPKSLIKLELMDIVLYTYVHQNT